MLTMTDRYPRVSVLMPCFNARPWLEEAVASVLGQSFDDFELLVVDDGSTDGSQDVVESFSDPRVRLIRHPKNLGIVAALNNGLEACKGDYVARMDADDICLPHRLARQVAFMDAHHEVVACGSWQESFGNGSARVWKSPQGHGEILSTLVFESCLYHPTMMIRRNVFSDQGIRYDERYRHAEDYELWSRLHDAGAFANLGEVLLRYRLHPQSVGARLGRDQAEAADRVRRSWLLRLGIEPDDREMELHRKLALWMPDYGEAFAMAARNWLERLQDRNREKKVCPEPEFSRELARRLAYVCLQSAVATHRSRLIWRDSSLARFCRFSPWQRLGHLVNILKNRRGRAA
ncbi:MAG: glycosyltransferase [Deltaproteobacteria bacterium]|nr:MAG: glycosyltransferase [Deltaproteobacteria bacterium]